MKIFSKPPFLSSLFIAAFMLAGCAGPGPQAVIKGIGEDPSSGAYIPGVPVIEQRSRTCGPAALATVLTFYSLQDEGREENAGPGIEAVTESVFRQDLGGSLPVDLFLFARDAGYRAEYYRGGVDDLREKISAGSPLILFVDFGMGPVKAGHYVVAVGYGDRARMVVLHSGRDREETMTYDRLDAVWSRTGYSTLLVLPGEGGR